MTQPEGDARYALRDAEGGTIQSVDWGTITGEIANQTDLKAALDGKADDADLTPFITETDADLKYSLKTDAPVEHGHTKAEIEGLQAEIDAINAEIDTKANIAHNHAIVDVTGLQAELDGKADDADLNGKADVVHTHDYDSITGKPTTFAPAAHNHTITNVTGLQAALDDKASTADLNGKANAVHSHTYDSITGKPTSFTPAAHVHTIANVTGLQAELDGKAATVHTHDYDSITGKPTTFAPAAHNHGITDVTGLQAALDGKADDAEVYKKAEVDTKISGAETIVEDNLNSNSIDSALSANQGRILKETKADINHNHDEIYSRIGHKHDDLYSPIGHNHTIADTTGLQAELDTKITSTYADAGDNFIMNTLMAGLKLWKGTQAAYDGLTPMQTHFIS